MTLENIHLCWNLYCDVFSRNLIENVFIVGTQGFTKASTQSSLFLTFKAPQKPFSALDQPTKSLFKQFIKTFLKSFKIIA